MDHEDINTDFRVSSGVDSPKTSGVGASSPPSQNDDLSSPLTSLRSGMLVNALCKDSAGDTWRTLKIVSRGGKATGQ